MEKIILHDVDEYKLRRKKPKNKNRRNQKSAISLQDETNILGSSTELRISIEEIKQQEIQDRRHKEDYLYLEKVCDENRTATIGSKRRIICILKKFVMKTELPPLEAKL